MLVANSTLLCSRAIQRLRSAASEALPAACICRVYTCTGALWEMRPAGAQVTPRRGQDGKPQQSISSRPHV